MARRLLFSILLSLLLLSLAPPALAWSFGDPIVPCGVGGGAECTTCDLFKLVDNIIDFIIIGFLPVFATLMFVIGGFFILIAGANPSYYSKGKTIFANTFWGVVIVFISWLIVNTLMTSLPASSVSLGSFTFNPANWYNVSCSAGPQAPPKTPPQPGPGGPPGGPGANASQTAAQALINAIGLSAFSTNGDCGGNFNARQNIQDVAAGGFPAVCSPTCSATNLCVAGGTSGATNINPALLNGLVALRSRGITFTVTSFTTGRHSAGSSHYSGNAADIVISGNSIVWVEARTFLIGQGGSAICETTTGAANSNCTIPPTDHIHWTR